MDRWQRVTKVLAVGAVTVALAGGLAVASAASGGSPSYRACASKGGVLAVESPAGKCPPHTSKVSIGARGPAGRRGPKGPRGLKGHAGTPATNLFVLDDLDGDVVRSSGGVSVSQQSTDNSSGTVSRTVTFPADVSSCVAVATASIDNGSVTPIGPLETSIDGHTVTVSEPNLGGGILIPFALAVFC
jgi:hypothetical protein